MTMAEKKEKQFSAASMSQTGQSRRRQRRSPVVDTGSCSRCGCCVELAPRIFRMRDDTGLVEVIDAAAYDADAVAEAMKYCPEDCIYWEDD